MSTKAAVVSNHVTLKVSIATENAVREIEQFELESQMNVLLQLE